MNIWSIIRSIQLRDLQCHDAATDSGTAQADLEEGHWSGGGRVRMQVHQPAFRGPVVRSVQLPDEFTAGLSVLPARHHVPVVRGAAERLPGVRNEVREIF